MRTPRPVKPTQLLAALSLAGISTLAGAVDFSYSGFANLSASKVISGSGEDIGYPEPTQWSNCPCFISDFSHGTVIENKWSLAPESRLGLQGNWTFDDKWSFTAQGMARHAAKKAKVELEWAYLSYNLTPQWTIQAGRKRLPLFLYSDFQDVSFAYNWVRVPPDVYGWAVVNYNGANITYRSDIAGWAVKSNAYIGQEHTKDNPINRLASPTPTDIDWDNMWGVDLEVNRDWFTARIAYNKSKQRMTQNGVQVSPDPTQFGRSSPQSFLALSLGIDKGDWIARSEMSKVDRSPARGSYYGFLLGVGYRIDKFTPMITFSQLKAYDNAFETLQEKDRLIGLTLRYQLSDSSSLKAQYDRSRWDYLNGTDTVRKVVTVSYDVVF
ncbi:porin [Paucibacter sp. APW11]|uniref:Porin n=1 Tax=Roseateles aquae TaxID=3077235 RepID=A0ABU3PAH3_9BURK|nr:porin [Paucibacter sp. APW11]MDT8999539.1 porin [Paucibacter sp. APW11]